MKKTVRRKVQEKQRNERRMYNFVRRALNNTSKLHSRRHRPHNFYEVQNRSRNERKEIRRA